MAEMEMDMAYKLQDDVYSSTHGFWKKKLLYSFPQFSLISLTLLINIQVIIFYNEIGVNLAFLSFFQIFARSFDVLTDPLMAHISDNLTRTKYGRRIPWLFLAPFYAISFFILMSPPTKFNNKKYEYNYPATYWFGASYILFYLCDTVVNIPLFALGPELSNNPDERTSLFMWGKVFEGFGTICGAILPVIFMSYIGLSKRDAFQYLAMIFGGWYIISVFLIIKFISERKQSSTQRKTPFVSSIYRSFRNIAFRPLAIAWILDFCALAIMVAVLPFFIRYSLLSKDPDKTLGLSLVTLFAFSFVSIPLWKFVSNRGNKWYLFGKRNAWLLYNLLMCVTNFLFIFLGKQQDLLLLIFMAVNGLPAGGQFLILSILADVIDYDELLNGTRREGAFTTFSTFIPKLVAIPAQALPLIILFMLGFKNPTINNVDNDNDVETQFYPQNKNVKMFLRIIFAAVPSTISVLSFLIKWKYFPIKNHEMMKQISAGVEKHKEGGTAVDPLTGEKILIKQFTDDEQVLIDTLDHLNYSHLVLLHNCMESGITKIRRKLVLWIIFGLISVAISVVLVCFTLPLLNNVNYAFVPALFCLCIGSSSVLVGFNLLRFRAVNYLKRYFMESQINNNGHVDMEEIFERVYYPIVRKKTKETVVWSLVELVDKGTLL